MKLGLIILLACSSAYAQVIELHYIPAGHQYQVPNVGEVRYYLFDEYKLLLKLDNDLFLAYQELDLQKSINNDLTILLEIEKTRSTSYQNSSTIQQQRADRLETRWKECEEALVKESGWDFKSFFIGAGAGIILTVVLGVVIIVAN